MFALITHLPFFHFSLKYYGAKIQVLHINWNFTLVLNFYVTLCSSYKFTKITFFNIISTRLHLELSWAQLNPNKKTKNPPHIYIFTKITFFNLHFLAILPNSVPVDKLSRTELALFLIITTHPPTHPDSMLVVFG